ncbi:MAG TPA: hypothetical protein VHZ51_04275, partial [Ktedonobacteraceae bacterium]|nr:hypothetical protein [Ktedonobacteraceae bacterium]
MGTSSRVPPVRGPGASEVFDKHPWGAQTHALAILFLPRSVGNLFEHDGSAHGHDLMDPLAVQALAVSRKPALLFGLAPPG